jgi:PAS domain S-box-containing protein
MSFASDVPRPTQAAPSPGARRVGYEWALFAAVLLAVGIFAAWSRYAALGAIEVQERNRLEVQARAIDENLSRLLVGSYRALRSVREDRNRLWSAQELSERASHRLKALSDAMPGVHTMSMLDAGGRAFASSRPELLGRDFAERDYFRQVRASADPSLLYVSAPFRDVLDVHSLNLTLMLQAPGGGFDGVVTATLDPEYFEVLLHSVLYAPDMWAAIAHADGAVLLFEPPNERARGMNLDQPGSFFRRHREAGQTASVLSGTVLATGESRTMAQRTVRPAQVPMDKPLVIAISREHGALYASWRHQTLLYAGVYAAFAVLVAGAMGAMQRRQHELDRLAAEREALQRAGAERLELALRGADLGLWDLHVPSGRATLSERWNSMLGLPNVADDPDSLAWTSRVHPDDWPAVSAAQRAHLAGETERFEALYRMRHVDGHWIWILDRGRVLERDAGGAPLRMLGTHMDLSEHMQAQQALRLSEQSLAITLHSIGDAVIATDPQGVVVRLNAAAERLTGWTEGEAVGQPLAKVFRILNPRNREPAIDPVRQVLECGQTVARANDTLLLARDGREYQISESAAPIRTAAGAIEGVVLAFSDVSERYRIEQALRANEQRLRSLLDNLHAGVLVHGPDTLVQQANPAACRLFGLTPEQMRGKAAIDPHWSFLEEDHSPMAPERYPVNQVLASGAALKDFVAGIRRADLAMPIWGLCNAFPLHDEDGRVSQIVVTISDITERRHAEQRILAAQADLQATLEAVPDLLFEIGLDGRFHGFHSPRRDLLYATPEQFLGRTVSEVLPADAAEVVATALQQANAAGQSTGLQYELPLPQGRHWFELSIARKPQRDGESPRFIVLARDITERKLAEFERQALERQLREAQKMESIGTLAGGIAHDFNNILAAILGNVALAREDAGPAHPVQASLDQINRAGLRARHLVQQILAFSRREQQGLSVQPLRPVVEETLELLRATLPAGVRLEGALPEEAVLVRADATQLQQVLINLCTNAWHALPERGGRIEVGFERARLEDGPNRRAPELASGVYAHLWVRDNGSGMDAATRDRIFDPFFTTKPVGRGTGLGLSVVHGILRAHEGAIAVDTAPGRGSTFHLYLPSPSTGATQAAAPDGAASNIVGSGQHVLYVDDDEVMVVMVERLLQRAGFQVTAARDAGTALACVRERPGDFDVVVTDFNMPDRSGIELARLLAELRPGLPVVISTGYVSEELREQARAVGARALLKKENTLEELAGLLRDLLAPR